MSAFQYLAINVKGSKQKGIIEAESLKHARQLLREQGLTPIDVSLAHHKWTGLQTKNLSHLSISSKELALMTRQLATLIAARSSIFSS